MVSKRILLAFAALVWLIGGFNVMRLGLNEYSGPTTFVMAALTVTVFVPFFMLFQKMTLENTERIMAMKDEKNLLLKFFTLKSYIIITFMMTLGVVVRNIEAVPRYFIAFFYTGLGFALFCAGIKYILTIKEDYKNKLTIKL